LAGTEPTLTADLLHESTAIELPVPAELPASQQEKETAGNSRWQTAAGWLVGGAVVGSVLQQRWEKEIDEVMERLSKHSLRKSIRRAKD